MKVGDHIPNSKFKIGDRIKCKKTQSGFSYKLVNYSFQPNGELLLEGMLLFDNKDGTYTETGNKKIFRNEDCDFVIISSKSSNVLPPVLEVVNVAENVVEEVIPIVPTIVKKVPNVIKKALSKEKKCKSNQVINPKTGRCILKKSLEKSLEKKSKSKSKSKSKPCKKDQIKNPESGRCVKKNGSIGKKLMGK